MTKVYSKCYDDIGAFNDTRYIVGMLEKVKITDYFLQSLLGITFIIQMYLLRILFMARNDDEF